MKREYIADAPLSDVADDRFGRGPFAERIADTLANRQDSSTLIVGLFAPWGAGKTTVLNFVRARLENHDNVLVADFNPWMFASTEELLSEFFALIAEVLHQRLSTRAEDLGKILANVGQIASAASIAG
jgi:predicted KAP-like P-loop ATPase